MPLKPSDILNRKYSVVTQELVNIIDKKLIDVYDPVSGNPFVFQFKPETPTRVIEEVVKLYVDAGWNASTKTVGWDRNSMKVSLILEPGDIRTDALFETIATLSMRELLEDEANYVNTNFNQVVKIGSTVDKDCIIEVRSNQMNSEGTQGIPVSRSLSLVSMLKLLKVSYTQAINAAEGLKAYETGE